MKSNICVFDTEYNEKNGFFLIGILDKDKYVSFTKKEKALKYLLSYKIAYAYNLEYDIGFFIDILFENYKPVFHYNSNGLAYIDIYYNKKRIVLRDLIYHTGYTSLKKIGEMLNLPKGEIAYNKMSKKNIKEVIKYNKQDNNITFELLKRLQSYYKNYGVKSVNATIGSTAFEIWKSNFAEKPFFKISEKVKRDWLKCYKGGYCQAFIKGKFKGNFYLIDVNSLYPYIMLQDYPIPDSFKKVKHLKGNYKFYIVVKQNGSYTNFDREWKKDKSKILYYYIFTKYHKPFLSYIEHFNSRKEKYTLDNDLLMRTITKLIENALYGKFAQRRKIISLISKNSIDKYLKNGKYNIEQINKNLYRVWYEGKLPYWSNIIYSIFTTARAREFLFNAIDFCRKNKIKVYYCDTDSLIINNIKPLKNWLDKSKIGKWKLEKTSKTLIIQGKKFYKMGSKLKVKGISGLTKENKRKNKLDFLLKGKASYTKIIKIREGIRRNLKIGNTIKITKVNKHNL